MIFFAAAASLSLFSCASPLSDGESDAACPDSFTVDSYPYKCVFLYDNALFETPMTFDRSFFDKFGIRIGHSAPCEYLRAGDAGLEVLDAGGNVAGRFRFKDYDGQPLDGKIISFMADKKSGEYVAVFECGKAELSALREARSGAREIRTRKDYWKKNRMR